MATLNDFLNPTSILTPGIAGGMATTIALPLATNFGFSIPWITLGASLLLSLAIVSRFETNIALSHRSLYCILNTLIIFSTSAGASGQLDRHPEPPKPPALGANSDAPAASLDDWLFSAAHAQSQFTPKPQASPALTNKPAKPATPAAAAIPSPLFDSPQGAADAAKTAEIAELRSQVMQLEEYQKRRQAYEQETVEYNKRWKW